MGVFGTIGKKTKMFSVVVSMTIWWAGMVVKADGGAGLCNTQVGLNCSFTFTTFGLLTIGLPYRWHNLNFIWLKSTFILILILDLFMDRIKSVNELVQLNF